MSDVNKTIYEMERLLVELKSLLNIESLSKGKQTKSNIVSPIAKKYKGLAGKLQELVLEGFFNQPKDLQMIRQKLKAEGFNKPSSSLMKPLMRLIKAKILTREKPIKGKYLYQKK